MPGMRLDIRGLPGAELVEKGLTDLERGEESMVGRGLVDPADAIAQFEAIEPQLYRHPAIDPASFRATVEELFGKAG
jgi:hypothetical protein